MIPKRYLHPFLLFCLIVCVQTLHAQCDAVFTVTHVSCFGLQNGSINLTPIGGTPPYTYNWSNGETDQDLFNVPAGIYTCEIIDAMFCVAIAAEVTVNQPDLLLIAATSDELNCTNFSTSIQTTTEGGTTPYTYLWSQGGTTEDLLVSAPGTYTVTVTDANNCKATTSHTVMANWIYPSCGIAPPGVLNCTNTTVTLNANCVPAGNPDLALSWTGPHIVSGANTAFPVVDQPGVYTLVAYYGTNGCASQFSVVVTGNYSLPSAFAGPDKTLNCVNATVTLDGSSSSTGPNYNYFWTGPGIISGGNTPTPVVNQTGVYNLLVVNTANNCTATDNVSVTFSGALPSANAGPDLGLPCGGGQVTLVGGGSNGSNIVFAWTGPGINVANQFLLNPIVSASGVYTILVTDTQNGCTATDVMTVFPGPLLSPQEISATQVPCFGGNGGAVNLSITQGIPPYTYFWSNNATTEDITGLAAGTYTATITDSSACNYYAQVLLTQPSQLQSSAVPSHNTCNGGAIGSINLVVSGATPPYSFNWSNGQTTEDVSNLIAGTYTCIISDANSCTKTSSATITQPSPINLSHVQVNVQCNGTASGIIDLTITGGVTPYSYDWSNDGPDPVDDDPQDWLNIPAGTYTVTVTAFNGCTNTHSVTLTEPTLVELSTQKTQPNCLSADGAIDLSVVGGISPYVFVWSNGISAEDISGLAAGAYTVTVVDANFCSHNLTVNLSDLGMSASASTTDLDCADVADGSIDLQVSGGAAPLDFNWSGPNAFSSAQEDLSNLAAGTYLVTITSGTGCLTIGGPFDINSPAPIASTLSGTKYCFGLEDGLANATLIGGVGPYTYMWSNGASTNSASDLSAGMYFLTVTDANGCTHVSAPLTLAELPELQVSFSTQYSNCESTVVAPMVSGGFGGYQFAWNTGSLDSLVQFTISGNYTLSVTDANGCQATADYMAQIQAGDCSLIKGRVFQDTLQNCLLDAEPALSGWILRAEGPTGTFYGVSNAAGEYIIDVVPGNYTLFITVPNPLWLPCWTSLNVGNVQIGDTLGGFDFPVKKDLSCPYLWVDLASSNLRRCFNNNLLQVSYCNNGTDQATNAYVILDLDPFLLPLNSDLNYTVLADGNIRFDVGNLDVGECGWFYLYVKVSCDAVLGQTHCTEAHIYPDHNCIQNNPLWSGASIQLDSECEPDSVRFKIQNIGVSNMTDAIEYIVIEDQVMLRSGLVQLDAGEFTLVNVPANGSTWRLEMDQEPYHPGQSSPSVSIEGCTMGASFSTGFVTQFPSDDADEFIDSDCRANIGSFDPNEKQAFPAGYGADHYIRPGTPLEYQIQFQNTGTDTAFTVKIVDTLSSFLDPGSVRPGASSHPYSWDLTGAGVLSFLFENILLPDSNVNEAASHGFVKFTIDHKPQLPLETVIENTAEIYFDFNEAIVTNTTFHRLGEHFVTVGLWEPKQQAYAIRVTPNPFAETAILEIFGTDSNQPLHLQVFDLQGKIQMELDAEGAKFQLKKGSLPDGIYLFKVEQQGRTIGSGKLLIQE